MNRPRPLQSAWVFAVIALVIAVAGCGSTEPGSDEQPDGDACRATADCSGEQACRLGYCTRTSAEMEGVRFQFIPPESSGFNPQTTRGVTVHADRRLDFALEPNVTVEGTISFGDSGRGPSGPLTFKRKRRDDSLFDVQTRVDEGDFETTLLPGKYDLLFAPDDYPSRIWRNRSFPANRELDGLSVPAENDLATIQGTVVFDQKGRSPNAAPRKVAGAQVVAVSSDETYTTTIDTTSGGAENGGEETEKGRFVLRAIPAPGDEPMSYDLIINPGPETLLPKVRVPNAFEVDEDGSEEFLSEQTTNLGTYPHMPSTAGPAQFRFQLQLPERVDAEQMDWSRTQVVAEAVAADLEQESEADKRKEFRRVTTPDGEGTVKLALLPARYTVSVYPPVDAPLASTTFEVDPTRDAHATFSSWNRKRELTGRVLDSTGAPVSGARLEFWPNDLEAKRFSDRLKVSTKTDQNGDYSVRLEPRSHRVTVRPPTDAGLPRDYATVEGEWLRQRQKRQKDLRVPEPMLLRGSVRGASSAEANPVPGTAISASVHRDGERRLLGKATTDETGRFHMIVPANVSDDE